MGTKLISKGPVIRTYLPAHNVMADVRLTASAARFSLPTIFFLVCHPFKFFCHPFSNERRVAIQLSGHPFFICRSFKFLFTVLSFQMNGYTVVR